VGRLGAYGALGGKGVMIALAERQQMLDYFDKAVDHGAPNPGG